MTSPDRPAVFLSYRRQDDEAENGRITSLLQRVADRYATLTGNDLELFIDKNDIKWGEEFQRRLDDSVQDTVFFIPIVTPRYFTSDQCRSELIRFKSKARQLGVVELLLPIYYVEVEEFSEQNADDLIAEVSKMQYEDWRDLSLADPHSEPFVRGVDRLARRLKDVSNRFQTLPASATEGPNVFEADDESDDFDEEDDDAPGTMDLIGELEGRLDKWSATLDEIRVLTDAYTENVKQAAADLNEGNRSGKPIGFRLMVLKRLASELEEPSQQMEELGRRYAAAVAEADPSVRAMVMFLSDGTDEPEERIAALQRVIELVASSRTAMESIEGNIESMRIPARQSRDMRRPLKRISNSLRGIVDAQVALDQWYASAQEGLNRLDN